MPRPSLSFVAVLSFLLLALPPVASAQSGHVPGRLIVTFAGGVEGPERAAAHRAVGAAVVDRLVAINADVVAVGRGGEARAIARYRGRPGVRVAELDVLREALHDDVASPVNDPFAAKEWGHQNDAFTLQPPDTSPRHDADVDAYSAWRNSTGLFPDGRPVRIAILDSGIDSNHEEFPRPGKVIADRNFSSSKTSEDKYGHGTHVAGTAAAPADNGKGVAGIAYAASLLNVKVLSDNGMGSCSAIANGIIWAAEADKGDADVINMSLGGGACSAEGNAVDYAWGKGAVLVAAAGNSDSSSPSCPACYANTIAVAATDNADGKASFSNYGDWVDLAAPGVKVFSTFPNHRNRIGKQNYDYGSGTSMAAPHVAGAAALVWPLATSNGDVRSRLQDNADHISENDAFWSAGRLNACNAVAPGTCSLSR